jgi:hypothetical protein
MNEETAFVWVVHTGALGWYRFEVYSVGGDASFSAVLSDVCSAVPAGEQWGCDNFNRPQFAERAVRAAFPTVEDLHWRGALLVGQLPATIAAMEAAERDTREIAQRIRKHEDTIKRLTEARMVTLV